MFMSLLKYLSPYYVYFKIISANDNVKVFDTGIPFGDWLSTALPYAGLFVVGIVVVFVINCLIIGRTEEV
jgi:p-aminobenzoyl-glutamate transporter AbgT